jgi:CubicO group peptidase (beta-lactamase class C family)
MWKLALLLAIPALTGATEKESTDRLFQNFSSPGSPGCAIGVLRDGRTLYSKGYGLADVEQSTPLSARSVFYLCSVSKQFMAFAILLLEQQGKLSVDDAIGKHIPGLPDHTAGITLRQLLHHTGGVRDYLTLGFLAGFSPDHVWTEHAALRWIGRQRGTNFAPGSEHLYSNSGFVLLSLAAQRVTGGKLNDWMKQNVYSPLGMNSSRWQHHHGDPVPLRAHGYIATPASTWRLGDSHLDTIGDGGMYSSVDDLLQWARNMDEKKIGGPLLDRMSQPGTLLNGKGLANGYGMGLVRDKYRGLETVSHGGALAGYRTILFRIPQKKLTIVCLCNTGSANPTQFAQQIADVWLRDEFPEQSAVLRPPVPPPPPRLSPLDAGRRAALAGDWWSDELSVTYRLRDEGGKFILEPGDGSPAELLTRDDGQLQPRNSGLRLNARKDASGRVTALLLEAGRVRGIEFTRVRK